MEHDTYGDEAACIIVDERGKLVLDDVYNGFDDDTLRLLDLEVKEVPEMPDPTLSVQDMKDYGYAWAGVLPAGQEAAEKALEKGCEVYRLYSDNTEGLCVDAKRRLPIMRQRAECSVSARKAGWRLLRRKTISRQRRCRWRMTTA